MGQKSPDRPLKFLPHDTNIPIRESAQTSEDLPVINADKDGVTCAPW